MTNFLIWCLAGIAIGFVFASFFEWTLHKYVMHRPVGKFRYAFQAHAVAHHHVFKADQTYHLHDEKDKETTPMAWRNGAVLVMIGIVPFALIFWATGQWGITVGAFLPFASYYCFYEYIHWCRRRGGSRNLSGSGNSTATTFCTTATCTRISTSPCRLPATCLAP